ncbi:unnamed protein product [Absidia cylindrospora]
MGNNHSQENVPSAITSHLSTKAKAQLSEQKPGLKHLFFPPTLKKNATIENQQHPLCPTPPPSSNSISQTSSSMTEYTMINGRTFINTAHSRYFLPCDEDECDRLIVLHFLLKYAFDTNYISPVRPLLQNFYHGDDQQRPKVLDIGTGAGTWILEMATEFSETDFYGIDVASMYPTAIKPSNAFFRQHDMLDGLPFEDESFDYIFMRQMMTCLSKSQLIQLLTEIARVLKPNGYLEIVDVEYQIQRPGPVASTLINHHLREKMASFGIESDLCTQLSTLLMTTQSPQGGFIETMQHRVTMPLGWGGQLGDLHAHNLELFLKSLNPTMTHNTSTSVSTEQTSTTFLTDAVIQHTLKECVRYQSHSNWYACTARKTAASPSQHMRQTSPTCSLLPYEKNQANSTSPTNSPPTPPLDPLEWESINSFVTGFVE